MKGIQRKISLLIFAYVALMAVGAGTTYFSVLEQRSDGRVINMAGSQRMLSQKLAKEALLIQQSGGRDSKAVADFGGTADRLERQVTTLLAGDPAQDLPPVSHAETRAVLQQVESTWRGLTAEVASLRAGSLSPEAVQRLVSTSIDILTQSDRAVVLLEAANAGKIDRLILIQFGFVAVALGVSLVAWLLVRAGIVTPLQRTAESVRRLASGDLTVEPLNIRLQDEVGETARVFDAMVQTLRQLVAEITQSTQSVLSAAEELSAASEESAAGSSQSSLSISRMAQGAAEQAQTAQEVNQTMSQVDISTQQIAQGASQTATEVQAASSMLSEMVGAIDRVAQSAASVAENTAQAAATARSGAEVVERAIGGMHRIGQAVGESGEKMRKLEEFSSQIGEIIQVISGITEQTNLLALNAAIEAARAGEHGRGFAVVAEEVRRLAERAATSAREITHLIGSMQARTAEAVEAMAQGSAEVESGNRLAGDTGRALAGILEMVGRAAREGEAIAGAALEVKEKARRVVQAFDAVAAVTEENSAATEEMAAAIEQAARSLDRVTVVAQENAAGAAKLVQMMDELATSATQVASSAQGLTQTAEGLQKQVGCFKV